MRWNVPYVEPPPLGTFRVVKKFLWGTVQIDNEARLLETAYIRQRFEGFDEVNVNVPQERWRNVAWATEDEYNQAKAQQ